MLHWEKLSVTMISCPAAVTQGEAGHFFNFLFLLYVMKGPAKWENIMEWESLTWNAQVSDFWRKCATQDLVRSISPLLWKNAFVYPTFTYIVNVTEIIYNIISNNMDVSGIPIQI